MMGYNAGLSLIPCCPHYPNTAWRRGRERVYVGTTCVPTRFVVFTPSIYQPTYSPVRLSGHLNFFFLDATTCIRAAVTGLSLEFRPFHLGPTPSPGHRYDPTRAAPQAPPTDTSITEDVEVPDFLCVAIPYDALFPQLLDPIPWTQCMCAPAPSPVSPYMARVPNACRDWEEIAPSGSFLAPHVSCFKPARRGSSLLRQDAWS